MLTNMKYTLLMMTILIVVNTHLIGVQSRSIRDQRLYRKMGNGENLLDLAGTSAYDSSSSLSLSDSEPIKDYSSIQNSLISKKPLGECF